MESYSPKTTWYAIYCKSRYEKKISLELTAKGIENYVPVKNEVHQWSDRKKRVEVPVLPNYIFVKTDNSQFYRILKIYGVRCFICFDRGPEPIPEKQIMNFKNFLESVGQEVEISYEKFAKGDLVEITEGSMKGIIGEVVEYRGKKNLLIRLETVQCNILTDISCAKLKAIEMTDAA
jgi:transcription antitermination factor NusG